MYRHKVEGSILDQKMIARKIQNYFNLSVVAHFECESLDISRKRLKYPAYGIQQGIS